MTAYRSQLIREVETDLMQARALGMLKAPVHPRQTYTEFKAERERKRMKIYQALGLALLFVIGCAYLIATWMVG